MANRDDVRRILAECRECGSAYTARQWPDGEIQVIGQEGCSCGSSDFTAVDESDESGPGLDASAE